MGVTPGRSSQVSPSWVPQMPSVPVSVKCSWKGRPAGRAGLVSGSVGRRPVSVRVTEARRVGRFTINQLAVSGVKVNRLDMYGEKYKPFKGVKYITRAGRFQVRT